MNALNKWGYLFLSIFIALLTIVIIGTSVNTVNPRNNQGQDAPAGKYPYVVSLRNHLCEHFCGGSIIHKRWVLTTAHCLERYQNDTVDVIAGSNLIPGDKEQDYQSEYIKTHKHWDHSQFRNDIGLIRVSKDIIFNNMVQPIRLTKGNFKKGCHKVTVIGWELSGTGDSAFSKLQVFFLKSITSHLCKKNFAGWFEINKSHICTTTKKRKGVCHDESGGPLVPDDVQIGVTISIRSCHFEKPDVYTRVYTFLHWIEVEQAKFGD